MMTPSTRPHPPVDWTEAASNQPGPALGRTAMRRVAACLAAALLATVGMLVPGSVAGADGSQTTAVQVTGANTTDGLTLAITGSGYSTLPSASTGAPAAGIYVALRDPATMSDTAINADNSIVPAITYLPKVALASGNLAATLTAPATSLDPAASYEVIVWTAHGIITPTSKITTTPVVFTTAQHDALFPGSVTTTTTAPTTSSPATTTPPTDPSRTTTITVTSASAAAGLGLHVRGTGYSPLPSASTGAPASGVYVALRDPATMSTDAINADNSIVPAISFIPAASIAAGTWTTDLHTEAAAPTPGVTYEVIVWVAHGSITASTLLGTAAVPLTSAQRDALFPGGNPPQATTTTLAPSVTNPTTTAPTTGGSGPNGTGLNCVYETTNGTTGTPSLSWGIKSSFVNYIEGNIAKGSVTTGEGTSRNGTGFTWSNGSGEITTGGTGTWTFPGFVHFSGHDGALETTLSNLRVRSDGASRGVVIADVVSSDIDGNNVGGTNMTIAELTFSNATSSGATASATLTAAGARALNSMYDPGSALDPLTISVGAGTGGTTIEKCYDAQGNLVSTRSVASGSAGSGQLARTGLPTGRLVGTASLLMALGLAAVVAAARRRRVGGLGR